METEFTTTTDRNSSSTFGLFLSLSDLEKAISKLQKAGFAREDISVLAPQKNGGRNFVYRHRMNISQGAIIGAVLGFFVASFIGFTIGFGNFASFQEVSQTTNTGFLPSWVYSSFIGGCLGIFYGAAAGALVGIGSPNSAAKRYGFYLHEGGIMLSVHVKNEIERERANYVLEKSKAQDITDLNESEIWHTVIPEKTKLQFSN
ncbi:MAG: hypothetical protein H7061_03335 [Bdellovibrionaceae bacterium]|nr:hypothetical protein [Bdellovibrio sp.]